MTLQRVWNSLQVQPMNIEHVIIEMSVEQLIHNTGDLSWNYTMKNRVLAEYDVAIPTVRGMFHQDTNIYFQVATIHFSVRNIVRAIANFKLQIATI